MPIASPEAYAEMLDRAKAGRYAYPAINVTSSQTLNAALKGFADAESDGIIQVSTGGAEYLSGPSVKDMVTGAVAFAAYAHEVAKKYPVSIALHTDHCPKDKLDKFVRPLMAISKERVAAGQERCSVAHVGGSPCGGGKPGDRRRAARRAAEAKIVGDRGRRRRWRGGRRRTPSTTTLHHHGYGWPWSRPRPGREGPLHGGADLRQRALRLKPGTSSSVRRSSSRSRTPSAPSTQGSRSAWSSTRLRSLLSEIRERWTRRG